MAEKERRMLDRRLNKLESGLPKIAARRVRDLRHPDAKWIRIPIGSLLVLGGIFSFLPILGIWMLPMGLLLLAYDVPKLRRPVTHAMIRLERWWMRWRRRRQRGAS